MEDVEKLQEYETRRNRLKLPQQVKPCVLEMLRTSIGKNEYPFQRSKVALAVAVEYKRLGKSKEQTEKVLIRWNRMNDPPLRASDILTAIKGALRYEFGCNLTDINLAFCDFQKDQSLCPFYRQLIQTPGKKSKARHREIDFYKHSWQRILTSSQSMVYLSFYRIEKKNKKKPGQTFVAPFREIEAYSGVAIPHLREILERLREVGLILCKIGEPYRYKLKATEITRISPIPKPKEFLKKTV